MLDDLLEKGSFSFQGQRDLKKLGGRLTQNTVGIIGWSVTLLKNASHLRKHIMWLAKDGTIILDLEGVLKTNYIS